jgi:hypothetical protein
MGATTETASQPQEQPQLPVKKSRKGLIISLIAAGVVVLGLAAGGIVYAFVYNSPENVVVDAFSKVLTAKSGSSTGTIAIKSQDSSIKVDMSTATNASSQASVDATVTITASGKDYTLKGHFAGTKDEFYVKLDDLRSVINGALGEEYSSLIDTYYGSLLNKIDGKWVAIKQSDLDSLTSGSVTTKETQCMQDEVAKLQTDASLRNELTNVYKKNPLFTIESKGSDSDGNHYKLTPVSSDKAKSFLAAMVETKFVKALDDCTSSDLKSSLTDGVKDETSSTKATGSLDIWIDGWSHSLNKVSLNVKDETTEITTEIKTKFNNNPTVTIPKGETTIDDLKSEISSLQEQFATPSSSTLNYEDSYDYSY